MTTETLMVCEHCGGELPPGRRKFCTDRCSDTHRQNAARARRRDYDEAVDELQGQGRTLRSAVTDDEALHMLLSVAVADWPKRPTKQQLDAGFALLIEDMMHLIRESSIPEQFRDGHCSGKLTERVQNRAARQALQRIDEYRCHVDLDDVDEP